MTNPKNVALQRDLAEVLNKHSVDGPLLIAILGKEGDLRALLHRVPDAEGNTILFHVVAERFVPSFLYLNGLPPLAAESAMRAMVKSATQHHVKTHMEQTSNMAQEIDELIKGLGSPPEDAE